MPRWTIFFGHRKVGEALAHRGHEGRVDAKLHDHGHRAFGVRRRGEAEVDIHLDCRVSRVIDMADQLLGDHGKVAILFIGGADHFPGDFRSMRRHAAVDFAVKELHDLRASLLPPHFGGGHLLAVVKCQWIGKIRIRIGLRFVVIGVGRILRVRAVASRAKRSDMELIHHLLMVGVGRSLDSQLLRRWRKARRRSGCRSGRSGRSWRSLRRSERHDLRAHCKDGGKNKPTERRHSPSGSGHGFAPAVFLRVSN